MKKTIEALSSAKLVPVVKIESERDALPIAKAVLKGGISVMEVTFRTEAAEKAIKEIADSLPEMFVGAGTLLSKEQVRAAKNAGAKFFVSPVSTKTQLISANRRIFPLCRGLSPLPSLKRHFLWL